MQPLEPLSGRLDEPGEVLEVLIRALELLRESLEDVGRWLELLRHALEEVSGSLEQLMQSLELLRALLDKLSDSLEHTAALWEPLRGEQNEQDSQRNRLPAWRNGWLDVEFHPQGYKFTVSFFPLRYESPAIMLIIL